VPEPTPDPVPEPIKYDPILNVYDDLLTISPPQYSAIEIQQMIDQNLTLDEVADKIDTISDLVQYLYRKKFTTCSGDLKLDYNGYRWSLNRSASVVFSENQGNCGGCSNLANYILKGDFDTQGYVNFSATDGGHIFNYFFRDGTYYFMDLTQIVRSGHYDNRNYEVYVTSSPQDFSRYYIKLRNGKLTINEPKFILLMYMYQYEGNHLPKGRGSEMTSLDRPYSNILPVEYQEVTTVLHKDPTVSDAVFYYSPPVYLWPMDAQ